MSLLKRLIHQSYTLGNTHLMSCLSALPLIEEWYRDHPGAPLILSKGHAWFAQAVVLESLGYRPNWDITHPEYDPQNGVYATTGSLGHGLPIGIGLALTKPYDLVLGPQPSEMVGVLMGDQECCEGTFWESLLVIKRLGVPNLRVIVDCNGYGATGPVFADSLEMLADAPCVQWRRTVRGAPVRLFEENPEWHVHRITEEEYERMTGELK